jgi:hypothetical protein
MTTRYIEHHPPAGYIEDLRATQIDLPLNFCVDPFLSSKVSDGRIEKELFGFNSESYLESNFAREILRTSRFTRKDWLVHYIADFKSEKISSIDLTLDDVRIGDRWSRSTKSITRSRAR